MSFAHLTEEQPANAKRAILEDLRGRRLLKWLFSADADTNRVPIGYVDGPIDLVVQDEIAESPARAAFSAVHRGG